MFSFKSVIPYIETSKRTEYWIERSFWLLSDVFPVLKNNLKIFFFQPVNIIFIGTFFCAWIPIDWVPSRPVQKYTSGRRAPRETIIILSNAVKRRRRTQDSRKTVFFIYLFIYFTLSLQLTGIAYSWKLYERFPFPIWKRYASLRSISSRWFRSLVTNFFVYAICTVQVSKLSGWSLLLLLLFSPYIFCNVLVYLFSFFLRKL